MTQINPRTFPIALALVGGGIISIAVYCYSFSERLDSLSPLILAIVGFVVILSSIGVYIDERNKYYEDRKEIHL